MHFRVAEYFDQRRKRKTLVIPVEGKQNPALIRHFLLKKQRVFTQYTSPFEEVEAYHPKKMKL